MFQFPTFAYLFRYDIPSVYRVAPFRNLRINGYLLLPVAYRSLSRLSSPPRAKASAMRPYLLSYRSSYIAVRRWLDVLSSLLYYFFSNMSMNFCVWLSDDVHIVSTTQSAIIAVSNRFLCPVWLNLLFQSVLLSSDTSLSIPLVENNGFEPLTLCVQGRCSSQLS